MTIKMNQTTADCGTGWRYDGALSRLAAAVDFEIQLVGLDPTAKPDGIFASMVMSSLMDRESAPASPFGSEPAPSKPIKSVPFYRKNLCPMGESINERSCLSEAHYDFTRNRTLSPPERTR